VARRDLRERDHVGTWEEALSDVDLIWMRSSTMDSPTSLSSVSRAIHALQRRPLSVVDRISAMALHARISSAARMPIRFNPGNPLFAETLKSGSHKNFANCGTRVRGADIEKILIDLSAYAKFSGLS